MKTKKQTENKMPKRVSAVVGCEGVDKIRQFETFRDIGNYEISSLTHDKPSSFNGHIRVRKYKVTIELIDEPIEVIHARLQELWDYCDNWHHWTPLKNVAKKYGYELIGSAGNKARK